ncbi:hypothetical protein ACHAPJ_013576 [Fusarium lateritium]
MSLKLLQAIAVLAASAHGLAVPDSQGAAFSVDALPSTAEEFEPVAERQRLEAKFPTTHRSNIQARTVKQSGSAKVKAVSAGMSFFVPTVIGNQTFKMLYDTGSTDFPQAGSRIRPHHPVRSPLRWHFGLALSTINQVVPKKQKTFFETLLPTLKKKVFAVNLRVDGKPATWDFGYIDDTKFKGKVAYTPVVSTKYWPMNVSSYAVGKSSFTSSKEKVGEVIVDSGTYLIYLPEAVVND